jgi:hypothetical protein
MAARNILLNDTIYSMLLNDTIYSMLLNDTIYIIILNDTIYTIILNDTIYSTIISRFKYVGTKSTIENSSPYGFFTSTMPISPDFNFAISLRISSL